MLIKELKSLALEIKVLDRDKNEIIIRELDDDDLDMDTTPTARLDEGEETDQPAAAQEDGKPEAAEEDVEVDFSMDDELDDFDMDLGDDEDLAAIDLDDEDEKPEDGE